MTFLTGASSGLGRSLAKRIAAEGEPVALVARRQSLLESLQREIEAAGGKALAFQCDVTKPDEVRRAVAAAEAALGPTTCLIANAGGPGALDAERFAAADVRAMMDSNFMGAVYCIEAVLPGMLARGDGHIVVTASLAAFRGLPAAGSYSAAKAALANLLESLRIDLRPHGIHVTVLLPGFVRTKPGSKKKKNRPFRMDLEPATARMHRAIKAKRAYYAFPRSMVALAWFARLLPPRIYDRLVAGKGPTLRKEPGGQVPQKADSKTLAEVNAGRAANGDDR
ncbi:MAG: SDR family NAD(P)-dependent oxidoreductase [Pseudomonadota bacterium]|nr:SDR family NAD(P)-dependent oxidoreductase [Pseudomonadota bacterium]